MNCICVATKMFVNFDIHRLPDDFKRETNTIITDVVRLQEYSNLRYKDKTILIGIQQFYLQTTSAAPDTSLSIHLTFLKKLNTISSMLHLAQRQILIYPRHQCETFARRSKSKGQVIYDKTAVQIRFYSLR